MPSKEFTFGFVLSAAMNSSFASSFAKASREVDELRKYMDKLGEETQQLQKAFGAGIINEKTFNTAVMQKFQSTHPMRGATVLLAGSPGAAAAFQSTHPMRGATARTASPTSADGNFNPRTPCGVRLFRAVQDDLLSMISIHAPHAGCDIKKSRPAGGPHRFQSTHPMRGATMDGAKIRQKYSEFQSTHPMRGATGAGAGGTIRPRHFNPRTPCGVRPHVRVVNPFVKIISIHAPHAGCDDTACGAAICAARFQSTHPMRGATIDERGHVHVFFVFQSTHPMRGATWRLFLRPR